MGRAKPIIWIVVLTACALFLNFYLPSKDIVRIVGTDVKRMDVVSRESLNEGDGSSGANTRDVRFINAVWPGGGPRVYRNEETDWGFPWYFKFDSSNIQAIAQDLVSTAADPKWVVISHYGWRIEVFSKFPNAVAIRQVDGPDYFPIPWFNIGFFIVLAISLLMIRSRFRKLRRRHIDPALNKLGDEIDDFSDAAEDRAHAAMGRTTRAYRLFKRWIASFGP